MTTLSPQLRSIMGTKPDFEEKLFTRFPMDIDIIDSHYLTTVEVPIPESLRNAWREGFDMDVDAFITLLSMGDIQDVRKAVALGDKQGNRDESLLDMINEVRQRQEGVTQVLLTDSGGRIASIPAVIDVMDITCYSSIRNEALCQVNYGTEGEYPVAIDINQSMAATMMNQVDKDSEVAVIILYVRDREEQDIPLYSMVTIDDNKIIFEHAAVLCALEKVLVTGSMATVIVRCYSEQEQVPVIRDGEETMIPRKRVGAWTLDLNNNALWNGMSQEAVSIAHEIDHETGELHVPEEETLYVDTTDLYRN